MTDILHDLSDNALAAAVENNLYALFDTVRHMPGAQSEVKPEHTFYHANGLLNPIFNGVMRVQTSAENLDKAVEAARAYFEASNIPYWFWWVGPLSNPSNPGQQLEKHQLIPYEVDAPGMAVDLNALNTEVKIPAQFRITEVKNENALDVWVQTLIAGMEMPEFAAQSWKQASLQFGLSHLPWRMYIGWLGDQAVAVSMSIIGGGVVGIIAVGVVPEARRQGIGGAITLQPLLDAREAGYRVGVLFSTEMGLPVYQRLGFKQYCTISRYLWRG